MYILKIVENFTMPFYRKSIFHVSQNEYFPPKLPKKIHFGAIRKLISEKKQ